MGNWGYNLTYRGNITPFMTGRGPPYNNQIPHPRKFNSKPLKNGWLEDVSLSFWDGIFFRGELLNFQGVDISYCLYCLGSPAKKNTGQPSGNREG